jgi:beta-glucanase (GH16 family)
MERYIIRVIQVVTENSASTTIANAASQFHVYKTIWSPARVTIYVDDVLFHSVANTAFPL